MKNNNNLLRLMSSSAGTHQILSHLAHMHSHACGDDCGHDHSQEHKTSSDHEETKNNGAIGEQ